MPDICPTARRVLGEPVVSTTVLGGGRNSRVFAVVTPTRTVVVKYYYRNPNDPRDRQGTEYNALAFLSAKGVDCVPQVIHLNRDGGFTVLAHADGERIGDDGMTEDDERDFLIFAAHLKAASREPEAQALGPASEAFFSLDAIEGNIRDRLVRLQGRADQTGMDDALDAFLENRFIPAFEDLSSRAKVYYRRCGLAVEDELASEKRVLSPSDFGLHNCIKSPEGLIFLDFEYFGWDDPAKLVSDFLLHPAQGSVGDGRYRVARGFVSLFGDQAGFVLRLKALLPLFALKWCMIVLNEFLAGENARREFSGVDDDYESVLKRQLVLAEAMLEKATSGEVVARLVEQN